MKTTTTNKTPPRIGNLNTVNQLGLIDTEEHSAMTADTQSFQLHRETFTKIDYIRDHKTSLNKFWRTEIIYSMFSDCNKTKLKISNKKISRQPTNIWKLSNTLQVKETTRKTGQYFELNDNENTTYPNGM